MRPLTLLLTLLTLLTLPALAACEPEPIEPQEPATSAEADLSAFERRRAASSGAVLEQEAMDARSAGARKVYASTDDEPGLVDLLESGQVPEALQPREPGHTAGTAAPTDLDRSSEEIGPWIDMDLVGRAIRSQHRSLQTCWDTQGLSGGERVDMRLTVNGSGTATDARIAGSSPVRDRGLERCLTGVLSKTKFPEARNGDKTFTYVLRF